MGMEFLVVDDEKLVLSRLIRVIKAAVPDCETRGFALQSDALSEISMGYRPDVAFLDIEMPGSTGIELANKIREKSPHTKIIFVTGHAQYALEAYRVHARGYVMKPVTVGKIRAELSEIAGEQRAQSVRVSVRCFGNFEVFVDGEPLAFTRSKAKELFAYLVHKQGSACTIKEIAAVLFEDQEYSLQVQNYLQKIISSMVKAFAGVNAENVIHKQYNRISVNTIAIDCDFYRFFKLDPAAIHSYIGEYMAQYSWAEFTLGYLDSIAR